MAPAVDRNGAASTTAPTSTPSASASITPHTADPLLAPFLAPKFDPTAYINGQLAPLAVATTQQPIIPARHASLTDLAQQTAAHLAALAARQARLVDALTGAADDILRSGSRLAYEVELLRGEAAALDEALAGEAARQDLARFVDAKAGPDGKAAVNGDEADTATATATATADTAADTAADMADARTGVDTAADTAADTTETTTAAAAAAQPTVSADPHAPPSLARLRTLQRVRDRLAQVIAAFDFALGFPLPPSMLAAGAEKTSFVSVAAPVDPALEAAGQDAVARVRQSINGHFEPNGTGTEAGSGRQVAGEASAAGVARAEARLAEVRALCGVWAGTAEERARGRLLDAWEREVAEAGARIVGVAGSTAPAAAPLVEGRRSIDGRPVDNSDRDARRSRTASRGASAGPADGAGAGAGRDGSQRRGLLGGLRRLRDEIYLD